MCFSTEDAIICKIGAFMEVVSSYAWTMRQLQKIAHMPQLPQRSWLDERLTEIITCGICHENKNDIIQTPCNHNVCHTCIQEWIKIKSTCPK